MNVLFLSIGDLADVGAYSLYPDLLRCFRDNGHNVYGVCAYEKRIGKETEYRVEHGIHMLRVKIGNITKCNIIEKGISTICIENHYRLAVMKYFKEVKFDLIMYSTPPITFGNLVEYIKKRDGAKSYLLLKDIFPQNAVDLGMMRKTGIKGLIYKYFRNRERKLYAISDRIGCMSQANVEYVLKHNPEISPEKVEVCPNSVEIRNLMLSNEERIAMRKKYDLPLDKKIFVYGGNLGKPQGIPFIIKCLKTQEKNPDAYFLIVGGGTEYSKLENYFNEVKPQNMNLMKRLPKEDYDRMIAACDIGLIFLDHRFTIPNFPSRLLSYMQAGLPVLACTDTNTDIGEVIVEGGFGWWCESNDENGFSKNIENILHEDYDKMQQNGWRYMHSNYSVERAVKTIEKVLM